MFDGEIELPVDYLRDYKYWLGERDEDDDFEKLVQRIERRVSIVDEGRKDTGEFVKQQHKDRGRLHNHGFNTDKKVSAMLTIRLGFVQN